MRNPILCAATGPLALMALLALGCTPKSGTAPETTAPSASHAGEAHPTNAAGDASYREIVSRTDIRGDAIGTSPDHKATLVVVFASWCGHCRTELTMLRELSEERPNLRVIGVNAYEEFDNLSDEKKLVAFLLESHPWLTVVRADEKLLRALGGVRKIPSVFVYDRDGAQLKAYRRATRKPPTKEELAQLIDPLLG